MFIGTADRVIKLFTAHVNKIKFKKNHAGMWTTAVMAPECGASVGPCRSGEPYVI